MHGRTLLVVLGKLGGVDVCTCGERGTPNPEIFHTHIHVACHTDKQETPRHTTHVWKSIVNDSRVTKRRGNVKYDTPR